MLILDKNQFSKIIHFIYIKIFKLQYLIFGKETKNKNKLKDFTVTMKMKKGKSN